MLGTFAYVERDFARALEVVGALDTPPWVTSAPLEEGVEVFLDLLQRPPAHAKTLLVP